MNRLLPIESVSRVDVAEIRALLCTVIDDERAVERLEVDSPLYGALPDLDSIAVVNLMLAIEDRFGIVIEDDEVEESLFATLGSLTDFVRLKLARSSNARTSARSIHSVNAAADETRIADAGRPDASDRPDP